MNRELNRNLRVPSGPLVGLRRRALLTLAVLLIGVALVSVSRPTKSAAFGSGFIVQAFSITGGTPTPTDNDYTRINDAVQAASGGTLIELQGTFNWTEPNAAASWANGSDGVASTSDDFSITVPPNLSSLTLTAASLGAAAIEGPGDLASVNLEAFLIFDGGPNQNCTISNLRIRNFDLSIAMFNGAGGVSAFDGTVITNNYILVPADLNATVAPADVNQNIGIHFSFGVNQTISNNTIEIAGNGVSDTPNSLIASSVGMQSNTSGGSVYDGLFIDNNTIRVLNAQSADPELILGIWENAHGHTSNITISNNGFDNFAGGNNPALNKERAFRVTSHSSSTTSVVYSGNTVGGANIGFEWIAGSNFAGNQAVQLLGNTLTNCLTGVLVQSNGIALLTNNGLTGPGSAGTGVSILSGSIGTIGGAAGSNFIGGFNTGIDASGTATIISNSITGNTTGVAVGNPTPAVNMSFNRIVLNGAGVTSPGSGLVSAENNWWGCNAGPGGTGCSSVTGNVDFNPWLVLSITAVPSSISPGGTSTVTASLTINSAGVDTSGSGFVPDGIPVGFGTTPQGFIAPPFDTTTSGIASAVFTAGPLPGVATVSATVDSQAVTTNITILGAGTLFCIQDDSTGDFMTINTSTGAYTFKKCSSGVTLSGVGTVTIKGCLIRLQHNASDRRVLSSNDTCQKKATATIQTFGPSALFTISDRNTANDTCMCP